MNKRTTRLTYIVIATLLSLFILFFTGNHPFHFVSNGLDYFKKGLDVAGGVRLTYKLDFSKYQEIYSNQAEFNQVKRETENIILSNIDKRISKLGVSDFNVFIQRLDNGEYLVVEIGGVADMDIAKSIIGKTIELEFKLPNEDEVTAEGFAKRKNMAQSLLDQIKKQPELFEQLGTGKASEDIFYYHFQDTGIEELPEYYQKNLGRIEKIVQPGMIVSDLGVGIYATVQNGSGEMQALSGFMITKFNGRSQTTGLVIDPSHIEYIAGKYSLTTQEEYTTVQSTSTGLSYDEANGKIIFNMGEVLPGQEGYNLVIYEYKKDQLIGKSDDELMAIQQKWVNNIEQGKKLLGDGQSLSAIKEFVKIPAGWMDTTTVKNTLGVDLANATEKVFVSDQINSYYLVKIVGKKNMQEKLFGLITIPKVGKEIAMEMVNEIKSSNKYDIESIFISEKNLWKSAISPKDKSVLNGANFKFASVSQGQTGKPVVTIMLDERGKDLFCDITQSMIGKQMAIFVGGTIQTAPVIRDKICGGSAQIDGDFTIQTAKELVNNLNEGAFPIPMILAHEEKISPTLGISALQGAILAGAVGLLLVYLMMVAMYGVPKATISIIALVIYLIIMAAGLKLLGYALSLSGIAAIILNIGMGIDAAILIFERLKEEHTAGKSGINALREAFSRSWLAVRDGNLSTGMIGLLLFFIGMNIFKGFGFMMMLNILLLFFINIPVLRELMIVYQSKK